MWNQIYHRKAKAVDVCNFYNNVESIWDHLVKKNKCFRLDRKTEYMVESGSAEVTDTAFENIANLALDLLEATKKAIKDPANKKPVKVLVSMFDIIFLL